MNSKITTALIVGLIVGFALGNWAGKSKDTVSVTSDTATTTDSTIGGDTSGMRIGENAIVVKNQVPGNSVVVSLVSLKDPSWVVIREDVAGKPGPRILGARKFVAGETVNGIVELLRPTVGGTYYAIVHLDNGDGKFDSKDDFPIAGVNGEVIMATFEVGAANTESSTDVINL